MPMDVIIRPYQESDRDACRSLWAELTQRHRDIYHDPTIGGDHPERDFDQYLSNPELEGMWVATADNRVVGFSGLLIRGEEAEIEPVIVSRPYRRHGIGRALIGKLVDEARLRGTRFLNVRPVARNQEAISFFAETGFRILGQVELFQELSTPVEREWHEGVMLHGHPFRY